MQPYLFTSQHLGFRRWQKADLIPFASLNADPTVMEFFPRPFTQEETRRSILYFQQTYENKGYTFFPVDELNTGNFIGCIGLLDATFPADFTPCTEIGWRLASDYWGRGYATEGAKACLHYAWENLPLTEIFSFTAILNKRSERIMQKIGMQQVGTFLHPKVAAGHPLQAHVLYRISAPITSVP